MKKTLILFFLFYISIFTQPITNLSFSEMEYPLNTAKDDFNPIISPSSKYLLFQSNRVGGKGNFDIWLVENQNYKNIEEEPQWRNPINFAPLNTNLFEGGISIRFNEKDLPEEIFFTSVKNPKNNRNGYEGLNLYYTNRNKLTGNWTEPIHLNEVNSNFDDKMPAISPDGKTLIFSSNRPGGFGGNDLWISYKNSKTNTWSEPSNLGKYINSSQDEISPYYHYDGKSIFFSSNTNNIDLKYVLYKSDYLEKKFSKPEKLLLPFNSKNDDNFCFSISKDGIWVYFASNRNGLTQGYNIFRAKLPESLRYSYDYMLKGLILDGASEKLIGLETTITIYDESLPKKIFTSKKIDNQPFETEEVENFKTKLSTGKFYRVEIQAPGYYPNQFTLDLRGNIGEKKSKYIRIILMPIKKEEKISPIVDKPKVEKKDKKWFIKVVDKESKSLIQNTNITLFSDNNREGTKIFQDLITNLFSLQSIPQEDFQIFVKADGYVDETKQIILQNMKREFENSIIEIELDKIKYDDIYGNVIYFKFNTANLNIENKKILDKIAQHLIKYKDEKIEIGGHTDNIGSKRYNIPLSKKRARVVKQYLLKKGINPDRISIISYWFSQPVVDNSTEENRAKNRRVGFKRR